MPTLVTGAAGFAGSHLLDLLAEDADPEPAISAWHRPGDSALPARPSVVWTGVDLLDRAAVLDAVASAPPALVYHFAGASHVGRAWDHIEPTFAVNVRGTFHLLDALERTRTRARVLIPSSAVVYRPADGPLSEDHPLVPAGPYGLSKLAQELLALHAASERQQVLVARAFNHIGPRQDPAFAASGFARQIAQIEAGRLAPEIQVGNLDSRRDLTDVRDTVRAYRTILERGGASRVYNVCSGHAVAIRDLLQMFLDRAHLPIGVRVDPKQFRPSDTPLLLGDPSRLRHELGWTPAIPLERTVDDLLAFWRARTDNRFHDL